MNPIELDSLSGVAPQRAVERRAVVRPFQSVRLWRPVFGEEVLWVLRVEGEREVGKGLEFLWDMWAYWRPDDGRLLMEYGVEDEEGCLCWVCQRR